MGNQNSGIVGLIVFWTNGNLQTYSVIVASCCTSIRPSSNMIESIRMRSKLQFVVIVSGIR